MKPVFIINIQIPQIYFDDFFSIWADVKSNDNKLPKLGDYLNFIDLIYLSNQINKNHFLSWGSISASHLMAQIKFEPTACKYINFSC